jgi:hypothetical protein
MTDMQSFSDTPDSLLRQITGRLHAHSTMLMRIIVEPDGNEEGVHIGSGTLVKIGEVYGVLTAQHVVAELRGDYLLGLSAAREGETHSFKAQKSSIHVIEITLPVSEEYGPDLGFIVLSDWDDVGTLKASRSFYDLSQDNDEWSANPPQLDSGIWFACGAPGERFERILPEAGFDKVVSFQDFCGVGGIDRSYEKEGFDYLEMDIEFSEETGMPHSFGGMSGGGLWQVTISRSPEGVLTPSRFFYSGVIFYQGVTEEEVRFLRCHGRKSIYEDAVESVGDKYA